MPGKAHQPLQGASAETAALRQGKSAHPVPKKELIKLNCYVYPGQHPFFDALGLYG